MRWPKQNPKGVQRMLAKLRARPRQQPALHAARREVQ
jgi:hypothetical protein